MASSQHSERLRETVDAWVRDVETRNQALDDIDALDSLVEQLEAAQRDRDDADKLCAHWCDEYDRLKEQLEAAREQLAAPRHVTALRVGIDWHAHEGMVTVYDRDGRYLGCMGVERFHRLLAEDAISRGSNPAREPCPHCGFIGPYDGHVCEPVLCGCGDPENCRYATAEEHVPASEPEGS